MDRWPVDMFHVVWIALAFTMIQQALKRGPVRQKMASIFQSTSRDKMTQPEGYKLAKEAEARFVGAVHIAVQIPLAFAVLFLQPEMKTDKLHITTPLSTLLVKISAGYFLHDLGFCLATREKWPYTLHAMCCTTVYMLAASYGVMHYYGAGFLMWELSTPCVYARWFMHNLGYAKTKAYTVNGFLMLITFFLARNVFGNWLTFQFLRDTYFDLQRPGTSTGWRIGLVVSQFVDVTLTCLNFFWVGKMFQGGMKLLKKQQLDDPKYRSD